MSEIIEKLGKVLESEKLIEGIHSLRSGADIKPSIDLINKIIKELNFTKDRLLENSCDDVITLVTTITVGSFKTNHHLNNIRYEKSRYSHARFSRREETMVNISSFRKMR